MEYQQSQQLVPRATSQRASRVDLLCVTLRIKMQIWNLVFSLRNSDPSLTLENDFSKRKPGPQVYTCTTTLSLELQPQGSGDGAAWGGGVSLLQRPTSQGQLH